MKCSNCGFEIERPNKKKCPLCGHKITPMDIAPDGGGTSQDATSALISTDEIEGDVMQHEPPIVQQEPEMPMVKCPICGSMVHEGTNFCPYCGHNMHAATPVEQPEISQAESTVETCDSNDVYEAHVVVSHVEPTVSEELPSASSRIDNYRTEDTDEYIDNGAYIPDQDAETDESQDEEVEPSGNGKTSSVSQNLIFVLTAVASLAAGAALYYLLA